MSYQNDYIQMYNLTVGIFQNMFTNIFTSVLEMDFKFDLMLYTNLIQYEQYLLQPPGFKLAFLHLVNTRSPLRASVHLELRHPLALYEQLVHVFILDLSLILE